MTDSSESEKPFENVRLSQITSLLDLIRDNPTANKEYIQRRYAERAVCFEQTLRFLISVGGIVDAGSSFQIRISASDVTQVAAALLSRLASNASAYRDELERYFAQFRVVTDRLIHQPFAQHRGDESPIRNFLMDVRVLSHDEALDAYVFDPQYFKFYDEVARRRATIPQSLVARKRAQNEAIGEAVELSVLQFELQRVGPQHAEDVIHVSPIDAAAGYDIASISVNNGELLPRYIEVKAVPSDTCRFYWTANEIEAARKFGSWYFLYLLPVCGPDDFDFSGLLMISDPYRSILASDQWRSTPHVYRCYLASPVPPQTFISCEERDG